MALIIIAVTWRWAGYNAIIILAGLQSIPEDVYEAATLDRVSKLRQFFFITLPLLKPIIVFCVVLSIIGTMQLFTEPFLITERGGPGGGTETLGLFLYRQGFTVAQFRLRLGRRLHHGGAGDRHLAAATLAGEGAEMSSRSSARLRPQHRAASVPDAAGADLAVSAVDDGGVLDHARQRHLQPRHRAAAARQFPRQFRQSAARHRFRRRHRHLGRRWR